MQHQTNNNDWMKRVITPAAGKKLELPKQKRQPSRLHERLTRAGNVVRTGNRYGMPRKVYDNTKRTLLSVLAALTVFTGAGITAIKANRSMENARHERFTNPVNTSLSPEQLEALYNDQTPLKLIAHTALDTDNPKMVSVQRTYHTPDHKTLVTVKEEWRDDYDNNQELFREVERGSYQARRYPLAKIAKDIAKNHGAIYFVQQNSRMPEHVEWRTPNQAKKAR